MKIIISKGTGESVTTISAFDAALFEAGIGNYNLIKLSSIIPIGSRIEKKQFRQPTNEYGHRLYVVMSSKTVEEPEKEAWVGLGWTTSRVNGQGLFVEIGGNSKKEVEEEIYNSINEMKLIRKIPFGKIYTETIGIKCVQKPVCAIIAAIYQSKGWQE